MDKAIHKRKYGDKITNKELKSAMNICKRLASDYYKKNKRYEYDEYLSEAYYGLSRSIKYYDKDKASFPSLAYISATNSIKTLFLCDKKYNYKKGEGIEKHKLPVSLDIPMPIKGKDNKEADYKDILKGNISEDETLLLVEDYIHRVFDDFYSGFKTNNPKFRANKDRDIRTIKLICKGYTPMEVSDIVGISNQLVSSITKKFKTYAIQNDLKYKIN